MARTIPIETKRGRPKKGQTSWRVQKEGKELVFFVVGNYSTHGPFYVTNMQIVKSNNSERSRTNIIYQHNLPLYSRC
jgi:hypothetical protein